DIALGRLRLGKIAGLVPFDDFLIGIEHLQETLANLFGDSAACADEFGASQLRSFTEAGGGPKRIQFIDQVADGWARPQARCGVAFAALRGDEKILFWADLALLFAGPLHKLASLARRVGDSGGVTVAFDGKSGHRFPRFRDAIHDAPRPAGFNADNHAGGNVRIRARPDERAEEEFEIFSKLQAAI